MPCKPCNPTFCADGLNHNVAAEDITAQTSGAHMEQVRMISSPWLNATGDRSGSLDGLLFAVFPSARSMAELRSALQAFSTQRQWSAAAVCNKAYFRARWCFKSRCKPRPDLQAGQPLQTLSAHR